MRTSALILRKNSFGEYDQQLSFYSNEFGKLTGIAKSSLKSSSIQSLHLDIFNLVDFELITGRGMPILAASEVQDSHLRLKSDLATLAIGYFFAGVIDKNFYENEQDPVIWDFLNKLFDQLDSLAGKKRSDLFNFFRTKQSELLSIMGYWPNLDQCSFCLRPIGNEPAAYSPESNGLLCNGCFLSGQRGVLLKERDLSSGAILDSLFQNILDDKLDPLRFALSVLK